MLGRLVEFVATEKFMELKFWSYANKKSRKKSRKKAEIFKQIKAEIHFITL